MYITYMCCSELAISPFAFLLLFFASATINIKESCLIKYEHCKFQTLNAGMLCVLQSPSLRAVPGLFDKVHLLNETSLI